MNTVAAYESSADWWINEHPTGGRYQEVNDWLLAAVRSVATVEIRSTPILEIGSSLGADAHYLEQWGYRVQRTDAAPAFVAYLREQGYDAEQLDVITDDLGGPWHLIVANAVLQHIPDLGVVLQKMRGALAEHGTLAVSLPEGPGTSYMDTRLPLPRYWRTWTESSARTALAHAGFTVSDVTRYVARDGELWMLILAAA